MNRIHEVFGSSRVLLPVVHPVSRKQALESVRVAEDAGIRGVFLINQGMSIDEVLELVLAVRRRSPALWVGVNLLGLSPGEALHRALDACEGRIDGLWSDNAEIDESIGPQAAAQELVDARRQRDWKGLYFGGVAFKYQRPVPDEHLGRAALAAMPFMDVVCTSGPGTGRQADVGKVVAMRNAMGPEGALALASGVTESNVASYLPYVDAYLVGTGIEAELGVLDRKKVGALQQHIADAAARDHRR